MNWMSERLDALPAVYNVRNIVLVAVRGSLPGRRVSGSSAHQLPQIPNLPSRLCETHHSLQALQPLPCAFVTHDLGALIVLILV